MAGHGANNTIMPSDSLLDTSDIMAGRGANNTMMPSDSLLDASVIMVDPSTLCTESDCGFESNGSIYNTFLYTS